MNRGGGTKAKGSEWSMGPDVCGSRIQSTDKRHVAVDGSGIPLPSQ